MESKKRSLLKALSWRVVAGMATVAISLGVGVPVELALGIAAGDFLAKVGLFYLHERAWARIEV